MIPSKIKIESFAKRCHMGTLGGKGLSKQFLIFNVARHRGYTSSNLTLCFIAASTKEI